MKTILLLIFCTATLISCKDNPISKKIKETKDGISNTTNAYKEIENMQDDIKELQEIEPLTNAELKAWLPDEINGMKRISFKAGEASMMKIASIEASYANEDKSKKFSINVIDGAGQMGSVATASMRMVMSQEFEEEDENKSRKTVTRNGMKAIEEYRKSGNDSKIQFMQDNRFYMEASGDNMDIDETWDAIKKMNVEDLG